MRARVYRYICPPVTGKTAFIVFTITSDTEGCQNWLCCTHKVPATYCCTCISWLQPSTQPAVLNGVVFQQGKVALQTHHLNMMHYVFLLLKYSPFTKPMPWAVVTGGIVTELCCLSQNRHDCKKWQIWGPSNLHHFAKCAWPPRKTGTSINIFSGTSV